MNILCRQLLENKVNTNVISLVFLQFMLFQSVKLDDIRDYDHKASLLRMALSFNTPSVTVPVC